MSNVERHNADGGGVHFEPCGCGADERVRAAFASGYMGGHNDTVEGCYSLDIEGSTDDYMADEERSPPPVASTAQDQEQGDSNDRLTSAIMADAAQVLKDCARWLTALGSTDKVLSGWIDNSVEALTERSASLCDDMQPIDELELVARVGELEKALLEVKQCDHIERAQYIARAALEGEGDETV